MRCYRHHYLGIYIAIITVALSSPSYAFVCEEEVSGEGGGSTADGESVACGINNFALQYLSVVGATSVAVGNNNIAAVGIPNTASVAIGLNNSANQPEFDSSAASVAIGYNNIISPGGVGIGGQTIAQRNSVAIGKFATALLSNSVAIGGDSLAVGVHAGPYTINGDDASIAGNNPLSVFSIGSDGNERQLQYVAAGNVSQSSTDAVNGSQLYAVGTAVNNLGTTTASALGGGSTYTAGTGVSAPSYAVQGQNYNNVGSAITAVDSSLSSLNNQVSANTSSINSLQGQVNNLAASYFGHSQDIAALRQGVQRGYEGTAVALAAAGGNFLQENQKFSLTGKFGTFRGQAGIGAIAQARLNQNVIAHAGIGGGLRYGGVGAFAGMTVGW